MAAAASHGACQVGAVLADRVNARHPTRSAGQAASSVSSLQPGTALQSTRAKIGGPEVSVRGGGGAGGATGTPWHAHSDSTRSEASPRRAASNGDTMGWIYLESLVALAILVAIVWWTMGARRKSDDTDRER